MSTDLPRPQIAPDPRHRGVWELGKVVIIVAHGDHDSGVDGGHPCERCLGVCKMAPVPTWHNQSHEANHLLSHNHLPSYGHPLLHNHPHKSKTEMDIRGLLSRLKKKLKHPGSK